MVATIKQGVKREKVVWGREGKGMWIERGAGRLALQHTGILGEQVN
jgi:hypothetical protein